MVGSPSRPMTGAKATTAPAARRRGGGGGESLAPAPAEAAPVAEESAPDPPPTPSVEPLFAARVPPPRPQMPLPSMRRAVFFDVENTSRAEHIARVLVHLELD